MTYEIFPDTEKQGAWRVESFGDSGECYITIFAGDDAELRARRYADTADREESASLSPAMSAR